MNYGNFAQHLNAISGSSDLELGPIFLQSVSIPGISFSNIEYGGEHGSRQHLMADTMQFNNLNMTILVDERFKVYQEFMNRAFESVNPVNGTFANREFDYFIILNNDKGNFLFRVDFYHCLVNSIGDIDLSITDDGYANTMTVDISYDYFLMDYEQNNPVKKYFKQTDIDKKLKLFNV